MELYLTKILVRIVSEHVDKAICCQGKTYKTYKLLLSNCQIVRFSVCILLLMLLCCVLTGIFFVMVLKREIPTRNAKNVKKNGFYF